MTSTRVINIIFNIDFNFDMYRLFPLPQTNSFLFRGHSILAKSPNIADPLSKTPTKAQAGKTRLLNPLAVLFLDINKRAELVPSPRTDAPLLG
jgi:hypothetical protein